MSYSAATLPRVPRSPRSSLMSTAASAVEASDPTVVIPELPFDYDEEATRRPKRRYFKWARIFRDLLVKPQPGRWGKAFRFLLEPLGLWITRRRLNAKRGLPSGFPRIASFLASDQDRQATVFKRFDTLALRNLLVLEARVAALEAIQIRLDGQDLNERIDNLAITVAPMSFEYFSCLVDSGSSPKEGRAPDHLSQTGIRGSKKGPASTRLSQIGIPKYALEVWRADLDEYARKWERGGGKPFDEGEIPDNYFQDRWEVAIAIQNALKEYHEALLLQAKVLQLDSPTKRTIEAVREWIGAAEIKRGFARTIDLQFNSNSAASHLFDNEKDLLSLHPPGDDDNGTKLVAKLFQWLLEIILLLRRTKPIFPDSPSPKIERYDEVSEDGIRRFTTIGTFFVAIGFLMGAVWLIRRVGLDETQLATKFERELAVLTVFTAVFGIWVSIFTSARRAEIFGATAAYAAVLIVFVGSDPGAAIPG